MGRGKSMKKLIAILMMLIGTQALAQDSHNEIIQRFLEQRKRMMEDIMKAFDDDEFFKDDFFDNDIFESLRREGLSAFQGFQGGGKNVSVEERMEKDGSISVVITPQSEDIQLDIETKEDRIVIKSEMRVEEESVQGQGRSKSISTRSFSQTVAIPQGYEAKKPAKEGK